MSWPQNLCRICGQISEISHFIFDKEHENDLVEKFKKCLKLEIYKDDYKPHQICNNCLLRLDDFFQFMNMCHDNDQRFESLLSQPRIIDYAQKMSVIVSNTAVANKNIEPLDDIDDTELLPILDNTEYDVDLEPINKTCYYPQQEGVLRHTNYHQEPPLVPTNSQYKKNKQRKDPISCPHCSRQFFRRVSLNSHITAIHKKMRPYICRICDKTYANKSDLTSHQKIHTDLNKCKFCHKTFVAPSKLVRHLRVHTQERPFVCKFENCGKSFSDKSNFDEHCYRHTTARKFICCNCGKAFKTKVSLKRHTQSHTNSKCFICGVCNKKYKYKNTLVLHLKKHNGYFCPYCKKDCEKIVNLIKHRKECTRKTT